MNRAQLKERIKKLTPEQKQKLKQYAESINEIKKEIHKMLSEKEEVRETGGPMTDLHLST